MGWVVGRRGRNLFERNRDPMHVGVNVDAGGVGVGHAQSSGGT